MAESPEDLRELITALSRRLLEDHVRNVASHNEVRQLVAEGVIDQAAVDKAYLEYVRLEGGRFRQLAAEMSIRYYGDLVRLGTDWSRGFYERLIGNLRVPPGTSPPATPTHVELSALAGEWAGTIFEVSNDGPAPAQVTFVISPFRGPAGEVFRPVMTLEPASLVLAPAAVEKVSVRVLLEPGFFEAGRIYTGTVEVDGLPGLALILSVWARAPEASEPEASPPASRSRPAKQSPSRAGRTRESRAPRRSPDHT